MGRNMARFDGLADQDFVNEANAGWVLRQKGCNG